MATFSFTGGGRPQNHHRALFHMEESMVGFEHEAARDIKSLILHI